MHKSTFFAEMEGSPDPSPAISIALFTPGIHVRIMAHRDFQVAAPDPNLADQIVVTAQEHNGLFQAVVARLPLPMHDAFREGTPFAFAPQPDFFSTPPGNSPDRPLLLTVPIGSSLFLYAVQSLLVNTHLHHLSFNLHGDPTEILVHSVSRITGQLFGEGELLVEDVTGYLQLSAYGAWQIALPEVWCRVFEVTMRDQCQLRAQGEFGMYCAGTRGRARMTTSGPVIRSFSAYARNHSSLRHTGLVPEDRETERDKTAKLVVKKPRQKTPLTDKTSSDAYVLH